MIHYVKIDDSTPTGKKIVKDLRRHRKAVKFENPAETGIVPEGYMTGDEFWDIARQNLDNICKQHGLL